VADEKLAESLRAAGFEVREAALYQAAENEARDAAGGWFDRFTGEVDKIKHGRILNQAVAAYQTRYKVDAYVRAQIIQAPVKYTDEKHVQWDGVEENIIASEGLLASINHVVPILASRAQNGELPASSLMVMVYDPRGKILYSTSGGIGAMSALARNHFVRLDEAGLLSDPSRMAQAASIALRPMRSDSDSVTPVALPVSLGNLLDAPATEATPPAPTIAHPTRAEIQKTVKTIALAQISLKGNTYEESIRTIYQNRITQSLKDAGYEVVSPWTYQHAVTESAEEVGGVYDPISGVASPEKLAKARELQTHALKDVLHVDAVLFAVFADQSVPFDRKGMAEWDGVSRPVFAAGSRVIPKATGSVPALSLVVRLNDMNDKNLYSKRAGIDTLAEFSGTGFYTQRPAHVLEDEDKASAAAKMALSGLVEDH